MDDPKALVEEAYDTVRRLAGALFQRGYKGRPGVSRATALANEYFRKVAEADGPDYGSSEKSRAATSLAQSWLEMVIAAESSQHDPGALTVNDLAIGNIRAIKAASVSLRRLLIDLWRKSGGMDVLTLDAVDGDGRCISIPDLVIHDEVMQRLHKDHPDEAAVVELRLMLGCSHGQTAQRLQIAKATVERRWSRAKDLIASMLLEEGDRE